MKRFLIILFSFCFIVAKGQQYNNEWIDYSKTYYKFKVGTTGLHRISRAALASIGLDNTDVTQFQLWRNGVEVPLYTTTQSGSLPANGYIEFWGEANDGKPDSDLYRLATDQINNTKSLFTDTASYFLTLRAGGGNRRLVPTANTPNGAPAEPYFMYTRTLAFNEAIHFGRPDGSGSEAVYTSSYEQGEGWASNDIANGQTRNITENFRAYTGSGAPEILVRMNVVGNAFVNRNIRLAINGNNIFESPLNLYGHIRLSSSIGAATFNGSNESMNITNLSPVPDRLRVAMLELTYPRTYNFSGTSNFRFTLPASSSGRCLEIPGFSFSGVPVLYDLTNGRRYEADATNPSLLKVYLQPSSAVQELVLVNQDASNTKNIAAFQTRNFLNYLLPANQGDYLMITNSAILNGPGGSQPVEEYRAYRSSASGGGYNARVYMVDQLIDQFGFGIKNNPLGVRNFLRWARDKYSSAPKQVFIVGKGVNYYLSRVYESVYPNEIAALNLVPTMGNPGSDILLTAQGASSMPLTPIGRVSVVNGAELAIYLEKVKQYEQQLSTSPAVTESAWKKNVIHMVGANDQATIDQLYGLLNVHKEIIKDTLFGTNVSDFVKSNSSATQQLISDRLATLMNSGVGLLSYFGHSSATNLGFNLDDPANYSNAGKYPLFNMMGCSVGDIFGLNGVRLSGPDVLSEKYVLARERGCIGMMAGTSLGYVNTLDYYNTRFYTALSTTDYGKTIGEQIQTTIRNVFEGVGEGYQLQRSQCEQYTLNGDPAIRLYQFDKPDYAIEDNLVVVSPSFISIAESGFEMNAKIMNLGKAIKNQVVVELKRTYPDLSTLVLQRDTIPGIHYMDSILYHIPIDPLKDKGLNKITITIDPASAVSELYESNNSITKEIFIFEDELRPVFPYDYSIVNKQGIKFSASTANPLATSRNYLFEIDTNKLFNSSLKVSQAKTSTGGVIEFTPGLTFKDSTTYYWRVASAPAANEQPKWNTFSFIYLNGSEPGFSQSHAGQLLENEFTQINLTPNGEFVFDSLRSEITVRSGFHGYGASGEYLRSFDINGITVQGGLIAPVSAQQNSLRFYLVNNKNMKPLDNYGVNGKGLYGSYDPSNLWNIYSLGKFFQFDVATTDARVTAMNFLDSIPDGYFVTMTNPQFLPTVPIEQWMADTAILGAGKSLYHKMKAMGLTELDRLTGNPSVPFVFMFQKNNTVPLRQVVGTAITDLLTVTSQVKSLGNNGFFETPFVGVAKSWNKLIWTGSSTEIPNFDEVSIDVIGQNEAGNEVKLIENIQMDQRTVDISAVNARQYPYLKLRFSFEDSVDHSPFQLKYWRLYYTPVPEGALAPNIYLSFKDTLEVGEPLNAGVAFKNVSEYNFTDSLKVKLTIRDRNNNENIIVVPKQKLLIAGDTIRLNVPIASEKYVGKNSLFAEFNPGSELPEQFQFNNFFFKDFYVRGDSVNPYLDVTFDGVHIINKDIVSSKPEILIKLSDNAEWMLLNTTDIVKVQVKQPDGMVRDYAFNNDTLVFNPANSGSENVATIHFKPHLLEDGTYELIVTAKDQSGNTAGEMQYRVAFQVINKPMISNLLNYPNPFTTSTAFVFTLTGSEIPQNLRIQILTITGKIVKEITKNELGTIRIGRNITEYKWDGTDQYGQKLANGVYLYRVITNLNGKALDKYTAPGDNTDKYFNKGYGKMYLMR